ncbi:hypothetical protein HMPREF1376_02598 [Enterococcus faecium R446]|nr:hypothetical protein HMPREF1382_00285 [Enterococcus faecium S447]EJX59375.1 hypothetical protein HMPREF1376_02598 [Enterococcus faecium R446]
MTEYLIVFGKKEVRFPTFFVAFLINSLSNFAFPEIVKNMNILLS